MDIPAALSDRFDTIEELPTRGAYAAIYLCSRGSRKTIVKCLLNDVAAVAGSDAEQRFRREVETLAKIRHSNIVEIHDTDLVADPMWYEMEFAEAGDLERLIPAIRHNPIEIRGIFRQICAGVKRLHDNDPPIIHRDLKPRNILLFPGDELGTYERHTPFIVKIADLGHVSAGSTCDTRLTSRDSAIGTAIYSSPQLRANPRHAHVTDDIYSLGIILIELCTGRPEVGLLNDMYPAFRPLAQQLTAYNPDMRPQSIDGVLAAVRAISTDDLFQQGLPDPIYRLEFLVNLFLEQGALESRRIDQVEDVLEGSQSDPGMVAWCTVKLPKAFIEYVGRENLSFAQRLVWRFLRAVESVGDFNEQWSDITPDHCADFLRNVYILLEDEQVRLAALNGLLEFAFGNQNLAFARALVIDLLRELYISGDTKTAQVAIVGSPQRDDLSALLNDLVEDGEMPREAISAFGL